MSWMSRNSSEHGRPSRSPLACSICWPLCDTNWNISRMLKRLAQSLKRATGTPSVIGATRNPDSECPDIPPLPPVSRGYPVGRVLLSQTC